MERTSAVRSGAIKLPAVGLKTTLQRPSTAGYEVGAVQEDMEDDWSGDVEEGDENAIEDEARDSKNSKGSMDPYVRYCMLASVLCWSMLHTFAA